MLLHGAVGGIGPFQQGKLCPPCVDLQLQYLEQARLLLLEEKLMKIDEIETEAEGETDGNWEIIGFMKCRVRVRYCSIYSIMLGILKLVD